MASLHEAFRSWAACKGPFLWNIDGLVWSCYWDFKLSTSMQMHQMSSMLHKSIIIKKIGVHSGVSWVASQCSLGSCEIKKIRFGLIFQPSNAFLSTWEESSGDGWTQQPIEIRADACRLLCSCFPELTNANNNRCFCCILFWLVMFAPKLVRGATTCNNCFIRWVTLLQEGATAERSCCPQHRIDDSLRSPMVD